MDIMQKYRNKFRILRRCRKIPLSCSQIVENVDNTTGSYRKIGNQLSEKDNIESPYKKRRQEPIPFSLERTRNKSQSCDGLLHVKRFNSFSKENSSYLPFQCYHYSTEDLYKDIGSVALLRTAFKKENHENDTNAKENKENILYEERSNAIPVISDTSSMGEEERLSLGFSEETATVSEEEVTSDEDPKTSIGMKRELLIEEILWSRIMANMATKLSNESLLHKFISQYEGYDKAMEAINDSYYKEFAPKFEDGKICDLRYSGSWLNSKARNGSLSENDSGVDDDTNDNPQAVPTKIREIRESLVALESALELSHSMLEEAISQNESDGMALIETLPGQNGRLLRYAADVGRMTSLMFIIKTRMVHSEYCVLETCDTDELKLASLAKKTKLQHQYEEAMKLKDSIDNYGISAANNIDEGSFQKFRNFIIDKIKLIIISRDIKNRLDLTKNLITYLSTRDNLS